MRWGRCNLLRILVIDDEKRLLQVLEQLLKDHHYEVDTAEDGKEGLQKAYDSSYDLLIVDVMLPYMNGYELVQQLRQDGNSTPILFLTAKDSVHDRVEGLDSGADDYLVKPFATQELLARVRALTRRSGDLIGVSELEAGRFRLNLIERTVYLGAHVLALTPKEFQLLELFLRNPNRILPKELILDRVWGLDMDINVVESYVHFLRRKIQQLASEAQLEDSPAIETVRGVGYRLKDV